MREIKSHSYLRKQAIYGRDLPVGDPGLPGNLREWDIPQGIDEDTSSNTGESEVGNYLIEYEYNYDYNENHASDIKITKAKSYGTGEIITSPDFLYRLQEMYEDQMRSDIEQQEESAKIERSSDYGAPEYDPMSKYDF